MYTNIILLSCIFIILNTKCKSDEILENKMKKTELINCVIKKNIREEFNNNNCLIISYDNAMLDQIVSVIKLKTIYSNAETQNIKNRYESYILIIKNKDHFHRFFINFYKSEVWNNKAKYLIIFSVSNEGNNLTEYIFNLGSKYNIHNINILMHGEVLTYFPYKKGLCGNNTSPERLSKLFFPNKITNNLHGCPIKLSGVRIIPYVLDITGNKDDPRNAGLETTIIYNILDRLNFTQIHLENPYPHWGYMLPDGNFTMSYKALFTQEVDIIFGMMIGNDTMSKYFDVTVPHIDTTAVWFVPVALPIAQWKNLTVIFDKIVWAAILMFMLANAATWYILGKNRERSPSFTEISLCLMGSFLTLLQGGVDTPRHWNLRFLVVVWSMASLLLNTAHQCQLTGILTSPLYEHQISNVKEMVDSNLEFGFYPVLKSLYKDSTSAAHKKLLLKYKPCPLTVECMNRTAFKRNFATIKNKREASFLMSKYYSFPSGKPMLHNFEESEFVVWCKYYLAKGSPFIEKINDKILLLQSNGLISKWEHDLVAGSNNKIDVSKLESLTLNHLQGAFFLLLFGNCLATVFLVGEKCKGILTRRQIHAVILQVSNNNSRLNVK